MVGNETKMTFKFLFHSGQIHIGKGTPSMAKTTTGSGRFDTWRLE